jgi:hypothetical protein
MLDTKLSISLLSCQAGGPFGPSAVTALAELDVILLQALRRLKRFVNRTN